MSRVSTPCSYPEHTHTLGMARIFEAGGSRSGTALLVSGPVDNWSSELKPASVSCLHMIKY